MDCSTLAELASAINKKIEEGMSKSSSEMGNLTKSLAPPYIYVGGGSWASFTGESGGRTGQIVDSIEGKYKGSAVVEVKHNEGQIVPSGYGEHRSVVHGGSFAGGGFVQAVHEGGRSPLLSSSVTMATKHMDKIANGHREAFVAIARSNIE